MVAAVAAGITWLTGGAVAGTAATVASEVLLYAGTTAASYFIQQANQPKQDSGTKLKATSGGAVDQSIIVGEKETAGSLIYAGTWGRPGKSPNTYYARVFCLQDMPSSGFSSRLWTGGKKAAIDFDHITYTDADTDYPADGSGYSGPGQSMGHPVPTLDHDGNHYAWVKFLDGSQTVADPYLRAVFGSRDDRPWTASMVGRGRTLMIVTQRFTVKESNSELSATAVVQGMAFYDWRKDSTNGGSGSHRWGDAVTYEYSANPAVILYNIMRGIYRGGTWIYGGFDWPARRFDTDSWTAAANVCDQNVDLAGGGTEKRYRMGAEIDLAEPPLSVMDRVLASFSGRLVESGGIYKLYAGGIGASVYSFGDDDVIVTEPLSGKMFPSREDICNTITGSYCEPDNGGQMKAYKKRTNASYVAEDDGEPRSKEMNFDYVRNNRQAQRLAKHALNDNRRFMTKVAAFPSLARKLEPGDTVNWSDSARFGFTNKKFIIGDVTLTNRGVVLCALREADATDADWTTGDEEPYTVGVYGDIVPDTHVIGINVTATAVKKGDGSDKEPAVKVTWPTDADMVDCKWVRLQMRILDVAGSDFPVDPVAFDEGRAVITKGIRLNGDYEVRAKIIPYSDRDTDWCAWVAVTANVGEGITADDVADHAPDQLAAPSAVRRTTVLRDGRIVTRYKIDFDDSGPNYLDYAIRITDVTDGAATEGDVHWHNAKASPTIVELLPLHDYDIRVKAISKLGIPGTISDVCHVEVPKKTAGDGNVPNPSGFTVEAGKAGTLILNWNMPSNWDHSHTEIRETVSASDGPDDLSSANYLNSAFGDHYKRQGLGNGVRRYYFIRNIDTSGNPSDWIPANAPGRNDVTVRLKSDDIDDHEIKGRNISADDADNIKTANIGTGEVKGSNVSKDDADNLVTKNLQKGSVTGVKTAKHSDKGNLSGSKTTVWWKGSSAKVVQMKNESGAVEFITLTGTCGIYGSAINSGKGFYPAGGSIKVTAEYYKGGQWKAFFHKTAKFTNKDHKNYLGSFGGSIVLDTYEIPGTPKKGEILKVRIKFEFAKLNPAQQAGAKWWYRDVRPGISISRR